MIKANITTTSEPTYVWMWVSFYEFGSDKLTISLSFHDSELKALENKEKNTNLFIQNYTNCPSSFTIDFPVTFVDITGLRQKVHESVITYINSLQTNLNLLTIHL